MKTDPPIAEAELREAVRVYLSSRHEGRERVLEELKVERGSSRVDFATVGEYLEGFELKSDLDSFARLSGQLHAYNRAFERITMVAGCKHVAAAEALLPAWWGLICARRGDNGEVDLEELRAASDNPLQERHALASLLGEQEAISLLTNEAIAFAKRSSRYVLHDLIATSVPDDRLQNFVKSCLATR